MSHITLVLKSCQSSAEDCFSVQYAWRMCTADVGCMQSRVASLWGPIRAVPHLRSSAGREIHCASGWALQQQGSGCQPCSGPGNSTWGLPVGLLALPHSKRVQGLLNLPHPDRGAVLTHRSRASTPQTSRSQHCFAAAGTPGSDMNCCQVPADRPPLLLACALALLGDVA